MERTNQNTGTGTLILRKNPVLVSAAQLCPDTGYAVRGMVPIHALQARQAEKGKLLRAPSPLQVKNQKPPETKLPAIISEAGASLMPYPLPFGGSYLYTS